MGSNMSNLYKELKFNISKSPEIVPGLLALLWSAGYFGPCCSSEHLSANADYIRTNQYGEISWGVALEAASGFPGEWVDTSLLKQILPVNREVITIAGTAYYLGEVTDALQHLSPVDEEK